MYAYLLWYWFNYCNHTFFSPSRCVPVSTSIWQVLSSSSYFENISASMLRGCIGQETCCWLFRCLWPVGWKTQSKAVTYRNKAVIYKSNLCTCLDLSTLCSELMPELWLPLLRDVSPFVGALVGLGYQVLERSDFFLVSFFFSFPFTCASWTWLYGVLDPVVQDQSSTV